MKKINILVVLTLLLSTIAPNQSKADVLPIPTSAVPTVSADSLMLMERLYEINAMDKSNMSASKKKELRKEVKSIEKNMKRLGGGVYISAGALLIILILLILFL
ncbi:MAG: hypothetical protein HYZ42_07865 [Bacteroidetes bacterium]|nr:hypothetical protein [Bacteroidota bacterium]